ncbi:MAG: hypothetical protein AB8F95_09780 [Bacteroidia bacterium]
MMKYVLPILLIVSSLVSCTGFESGPAISFKAAAKNMNNTWAVSEAIMNGTDVTATYASDVITFEELGAYSYLESAKIITSPPFTKSDTIPILGVGTWNFLDANNQIEVLYRFSYKDLFDPEIMYDAEIYEQWEITRLTAEEFWLRSESLSLKLEPI